MPFIFLCGHLLHMYWFENIFQIPFLAVLICASLPRRDYICCHAHALWGYVLFFNNCFTRVNRRLVNSFSYGNRIFWSKENVIVKFKNKQTRTQRFRQYIFCKYCELWNWEYVFRLEEVVTSKIKHTMNIDDVCKWYVYKGACVYTW